MNKKKILVFIDWYLPGYKAGGPVKSVVSFIGLLKNTFDFSVITTNTDYTSSLPYSTVNSEKWTTAPDGTRTWYFSKNKLSYGTITQLLKNESYDAIYLNGIFSLYFSIIPLFIHRSSGKKIVVAPKGMLAAGARSIKPLKKNIFLSLAKLLGLFKHVTWHASSEEEKSDIEATFGKNSKIIIATNLSSTKIIKNTNKLKEKNNLKLFYLGRISEEKNTLGAIEFLKQIKSGVEIELDIFGSIYNEEYWNKCMAIIQSLPSHIQINYKGSISSTEVQETIKNYHFLLLPTLGENFGHAILESMASGCPVIISDKTIWKDLEKENAGWDLPLAERHFIDTITKCAEMDQAAYQKLSDGAIQYATAFIENPKFTEQNTALFNV